MTDNLLQQLARPFQPSRITWKPGALNKDRSRALALPYADLRAYMERLDQVAGLDWSVQYRPWGDGRIICELTIGGVTRSSTGEPDNDRNGNAGTAAEAQAFKRAAAMFGLGRYLYDQLPTPWVDYDAKRKGFSEPAQRKLASIVHSHFKRHAGESPTSRNGTQPDKATANHIPF